MERKYKIKSVHTLIPMQINFFENEQFYSIMVDIHYSGDKVFFRNEDLKLLPLDFDDLEQEILSYLRPNFINNPNIDPTVFDKINKIKSGHYKSAFDVNSYTSGNTQ